MRVLTIVHDEDAGPGVFFDALAPSGAEVDTWLIPTQMALPAPASDYDAILSFGGSANPDQADSHPWLTVERRFLADALRERVPLLGVCLGAELIAEAQDTSTRRMQRPEIGWYDVALTAAGAEDPLLGPIGQPFPALEWHSFEVVLPASATELARSANCLQSFRVGDHAWGIQFHAEVTGADFQHWIDEFRTDDGFVELGIEPEALSSQTRARIVGWNELGRGLCARFLEVAAAR
jgi:GMP synthase (glutamine-hydrolysing)